MSGQASRASTAKVAKSNRGSKPGERRGGRVAGTPNKVSKTLRELAREYTDEALEALATIIRSSDSDAARVSAIKELLDRGYGKASQIIGGDQDNPLNIMHRIELVGVVAK